VIAVVLAINVDPQKKMVHN